MTEYSNPQTPIRLAMLNNGYRPTMNNGKRSRGRDWAEKAARAESSVRASIKWWDTATTKDGTVIQNDSTGLLIHGDLIALDIDVDDFDAVTALLEHGKQVFGDAWHQNSLLRIRQGSDKVCVVFRANDPVPGDQPFARDGKVVGRKYLHPSVTMDGAQIAGIVTEGGWTRDVEGVKPQTIEFFRGGACQIGAHGYHTLPGESDDHPDGIVYEWDNNKSPATVPHSDLPVVSHAQLMEFFASWGRVLTDLGWKLDTRASAGGGGCNYLYDLDIKKMFIGWGETAIPYEDLRHHDNVRMMEVVGDGTNPERGLVIERSNGVRGIFDRQYWVVHYPASEDPGNAKVMAKRLGELLKALSVKHAPVDEDADEDTTLMAEVDIPVDPPHPDDEVFERVNEILADHGVSPSVQDEDMEEVIEVYRRATSRWGKLGGDYQVEARAWFLALRWLYVDFPGAAQGQPRMACLVPGKAKGLSISAFKGSYNVNVAVYKKRLPDEDDEGGDAPVTWSTVGTLFMDSKMPIKIEDIIFDPRTNHTVSKNDEGFNIRNLYREPKLGTPRQELVDLFVEFQEFMWNEPDELAYWNECMSYKFLNRAERGAAHLLVAEGVEGVGRNTLVENLLFSALGQHNCVVIPTSKISTGQSQYDSWMFEGLMWFIPEIEYLDSLQFANLKEKFEVSSGVVRGTEKGGRDITGRVYGTPILATNNPSSFHMDQQTDNRRWYIHGQGMRGALVDNPDLKKRIDAQRLDGGRMTPDMAASVAYYFTVVWPQQNWAPRHSIFTQGQDTVSKRRVAMQSRKTSHVYLQDVLEDVEEQGLKYVTFGDVKIRAKAAAAGDGVETRHVAKFRTEFTKLLGSPKGWKGWVRVGDKSGGDTRVNIGQGRKVSVLALGHEAAEAFLAMSQEDRGAAMVLASGGRGGNVSKLGLRLSKMAKTLQDTE